MKHFLILFLAISSLPTLGMERSAVADASARRKRECEFLKAVRDNDFTNPDADVGLYEGLYITALDVYGRSALHLHFERLRGYIVRSLPKMAEYEITQQDSISGNTPLHTFLETTLTALCSQPLSCSSTSYGSLIEQLIPLISEKVLTTPNYLGKLPYDYLDENSTINDKFPILKRILKPHELSVFNPGSPRLLTAPLQGTATLEECLKPYIDRKIVTAVLHALQIKRKRTSMSHKDFYTITNTGRKILQFLAIWDHLTKHLKTFSICQPEISHKIAWYHQFEPEFSEHDKGAVVAMLTSTTIRPSETHKS